MYDLIEQLIGIFGPYTYEILFQVPNVQKYLIKYRIEYNKIKSVRDGLHFCDPCKEFPR